MKVWQIEVKIKDIPLWYVYDEQEGNGIEKVTEFDVIGNDFLNPEIRKVFSEDHLFKYGTPNPEMKRTGIACGGCGAELNAK